MNFRIRQTLAGHYEIVTETGVVVFAATTRARVEQALALLQSHPVFAARLVARHAN